MAAFSAKSRAFVKQLVQLSLIDGRVSSEQVAGVLAYLEKNPPARLQAVLLAYHKAIAAELAKSEARVEHAGPVAPEALSAIAAALGKRYGRAVTTTAKPNPALLAGIRVRIADDVYESSVAGQLQALASAS
ncbi:MAG: F0F1 ATP synthase subunit delta [Opitutaceae bacterium]|jgi:F-type H+-transporting ATPase subunit delta|nr:F0F1 ATP synthase subunit delta [Opitutaceae bacterium]